MRKPQESPVNFTPYARNEKEESPYKPEAFDSRLKRGIAHVSAHKEIQG